MSQQIKSISELKDQKKNFQSERKQKKIKVGNVKISWASSDKERNEVYKLRYKIFAEEMGANINGGKKKIDKDIFDDYCEHLIARDIKSEKIIGTYRVLTPLGAKNLGYLYFLDAS